MALVMFLAVVNKLLTEAIIGEQPYHPTCQLSGFLMGQQSCRFCRSPGFPEWPRHCGKGWDPHSQALHKDIWNSVPVTVLGNFAPERQTDRLF